MEQNPGPTNDNRNPFLRFDTALDELYRLRRVVLRRDPKHHTLAPWRKRQAALEELDEKIRYCLSRCTGER